MHLLWVLPRRERIAWGASLFLVTGANLAAGRPEPRTLAAAWVGIILESVKKLEELFIAPTARQILHETAQRAFARCECA